MHVQSDIKINFPSELGWELKSQAQEIINLAITTVLQIFRY